MELRGTGKPIAWTDQVINWWQMAGHGDTRDQALANLRVSFETFRSRHDVLPRPGSGAPLEFASSHLVERYETLARDFLQRLLGLNHDDCFISDQSSLWDFNGGDSNDTLYRKISDLYGVDVSDVDSARLGKILEKIALHQKAG